VASGDRETLPTIADCRSQFCTLPSPLLSPLLAVRFPGAYNGGVPAEVAPRLSCWTVEAVFGSNSSAPMSCKSISYLKPPNELAGTITRICRLHGKEAGRCDPPPRTLHQAYEESYFTYTASQPSIAVPDRVAPEMQASVSPDASPVSFWR
jgi:hypothetical protein